MSGEDSAYKPVAPYLATRMTSQVRASSADSSRAAGERDVRGAPNE